MQSSHYKAVSQWLKEIALLLFAALVIQNILKGAEISDPIVIAGIALSFMAYACALYLLLKS